LWIAFALVGCSRSSSAPETRFVDASVIATVDADRPVSSIDDPLAGLGVAPLYPAPSSDITKTVVSQRWFRLEDEPIAVAKGERFVINQNAVADCRPKVSDDKGLIRVEAQEVVGLGFPTPGRAYHTVVVAIGVGQSKLTFECTAGEPLKHTVPLHVR
jgi:hypothetical protein